VAEQLDQRLSLPGYAVLREDEGRVIHVGGRCEGQGCARGPQQALHEVVLIDFDECG
jgi:hypothetical protein